MSQIRAISFDLWDTIVHDDSDEPKRREQGLRSKYEERRHLVWEAATAVEPIDYETVRLAYDAADAGFNLTWKEYSINWRVEQRIRVVLSGLDRTLPDDVFERVVERTGAMEVETPPNAIEGVQQALSALSKQYPLAIVSDAIVTPGSGLRKLLEHHGVLQYFSGFAFSDEVGHSKPHRSMFESAATQLGVGIDELIHIGDRDHNDVKGPHAVGSKAVLLTVTRDIDRENTTADAICDRYSDLPGIIEKLAARGGK